VLDDWSASALTGREWAVVTWGVIVLVLCVVVPSMRPQVIAIVKATLAWRIVAVFAGLWSYTLLMSAIAVRLGAWGVGLTKDTVIWSAGTGVLLVARSISPRKPRHFRRMLVELFELSAVLQFLGALYSFGYLVELVGVPFLLLLGAMQAVANDEEQRPVKVLARSLLAFWGVAVLARSVWSLAQSWDHLDKGFVAYQAALPVWLTLTVVPYAYLVALISEYGVLFSRLGFDAQHTGLRVPRLALLMAINVRLSRFPALRGHRLGDLTGPPQVVRRRVREYADRASPVRGQSRHE
jgi:hypothetical protein